MKKLANAIAGIALLCAWGAWAGEVQSGHEATTGTLTVLEPAKPWWTTTTPPELWMSNDWTCNTSIGIAFAPTGRVRMPDGKVVDTRRRPQVQVSHWPAGCRSVKLVRSGEGVRAPRWHPPGCAGKP